MEILFRIIYSAILIIAGIGHFTKVESFNRIVPNFLYFKTFIVKFTGILEILFGIFLWIKKGQSITSKLLAGFMLAVFPANIKMAIEEIPIKPNTKPNKALLWLRLPLQIPFIIGALKLGRK
ncbi:DoxX family protein [Staphylococcus caeli]|uniref:DoxX family protein n=1 Tax=Staphylococcus caeli TaxID=2201815 RepID=UPI003F57680F